MVGSRTKEIILNTRKSSIQYFENEELEYRSYKDQLRRIVIHDIDNKIKTMQILHQIRGKKLYLIDGYKKFEDFLSEFIISRSQAFLYLKIYKKVLDGSVSIEDIKQKGFKSVYRDVVNLATGSKSSKLSSIKPLKLQLKNQESYDFYKKNVKLTEFILDKLFSDEKKILKKLVNEFNSLKG
ncbi:chromosome replication/partitioning protein (plasmid) [Borrelia coriaceae]|uniref:Putative plasmid partition protein n=1 Tax=Borrelia coriaceae ATCC 43381 TaxID=1408429 RepID=W5T1W2_9SPIR|nr:chromosome replication/partitioning protein [Borrelia coriaceae]AHH11271.1 Putative plasmid partition protein [Borrelia coriaceae ATCC 43381]UPA17427.1 chromosome replication/partitioning protein [Borrelia coriaceae]